MKKSIYNSEYILNRAYPSLRSAVNSFPLLEIDIIIGYYFEDKAFAAVPAKKFEGNPQLFIKQDQDNFSKYLNSWDVLEEINQ
jgi:hypothetical protein